MINWLNLGGGNNSYFHKTIKVRNSTNLIKMIKDDEGNKLEDMVRIKDVVVGFYKRLLGSMDLDFSDTKAARITHLIRRKFSSVNAAGMGAEVSREEVCKAIFSMNKERSPGPNGFSAGFFPQSMACYWRRCHDCHSGILCY